MKHAICFDCRFWQEIIRRESVKFGADLEYIINFTEVHIISINHQLGDIWFLIEDICKIHSISPTTIYCIPTNLTQSHIYDISISPSNAASAFFKLLKQLSREHKYEMPEVPV